jgi:hypothetical protein
VMKRSWSDAVLALGFARVTPHPRAGWGEICCCRIDR